ncbi:MAG: amidohydrolase [Ruminococcaceae bacterium]|nr:amidohydrolase [Oscillospiraceae bacterium]
MKTIFKNALVITPDGAFIENGAVVVDGARIVYVGESAPEGAYDRVIDCAGKLLSPAFYNIHCHAAMTLFRGIGEDLPLGRWLEEKIYPAEDRLTPESVRVGSELAIAEMIRSGCVSFSDMYFFCDETAKAAIELGVKANISRCLVSFADDAAIHGDSRFEEAVRLADEFHGAADGRILIDMSVHAEYTNREKYLRQVAEYTRERGLNMQVHVSETESEHLACMERHNGRTPVQFLADCGILTPSATGTATAAHCVWVSEEDMKILAENRVSVAHNPVSNLKLASGVSPVHKLMAAGVNVGLGTDGAASNNCLSVLRELQTAALIHKGVNRQADIIKTADICKMAWENGARSQGRPDCGRIKEGARADIILLDLDALNNIPMYDPYASIAFSADSRDVALTMCDGKILYENGEFKTLDVEKLRHTAKHTIAHYFD